MVVLEIFIDKSPKGGHVGADKAWSCIIKENANHLSPRWKKFCIGIQIPRHNKEKSGETKIHWLAKVFKT